MFERNELYRVYKISIPIIDLLVPYWNLYISIKGINIIESFQFSLEHEAYKNNCIDIFNDYQHKRELIKDEDDITSLEDVAKKQILNELTKYVSASIYNMENFIGVFKKHLFAIVHKDDSFLCVTKDCNEEKMTDLLDKFLQKSNPIKILLHVIDANNEKIFSDMINCGLYSIAAADTIDNAEIRSIYAPIYNITDFNPTDHHTYYSYELDSSEYWINHNLIKECLDSEYNQDDKVIVFSKNEINSTEHIDGLYMKDIIIPFVSDFKEQYPLNLKAIWREFKSNVYHHKKDDNTSVKLIKSQKDFLERAKNEDVTNSLSYLVDNLFIHQEDIDKIKDINSFFNDITIVEGLEELKNYEFFSSRINDDYDNKPFIGIHKKDKAGTTTYKLLHYINKKGKKLENIRGHNQISGCNSRIAKVLKPDLAFYYLLRYYEDFFSLALNEIKQETSNIIDFIANQNLHVNNCENKVDILAFNGTDIYVIELKTNLSIDYIVSYQKKCNKWLLHNSEIADNLKFVIAGNFGSETLNICVNNNMKIEGYNAPRMNMNGYAYSFSVPLNDNHELLCFTESSFERLKLKLSKILIKNEAPNN